MSWGLWLRREHLRWRETLGRYDDGKQRISWSVEDIS